MIGFLHPWILLALPVAAIPLVLHLVARRDPPTVVFPAVRYLMDTTREHQRRLRLRNWLLLLIRTLLLLLLVLAAAGPSAPTRSAGIHAPTALVLILDNSVSAGAVVRGTPVLVTLKAASRAVLREATSEDAVWLVGADAVPRRADPSGLLEAVESLTVSPRRMDLGEALGVANRILGSESRPGEIVLVSDLQRSAVTPATVGAPLLVVRPPEAAIPNLGIAVLDPGAQPWTSEGGQIAVTVSGNSTRSAPLSVQLGDRPARQALAVPGAPMTIALSGARTGWWPLRAMLEPDEFRADDERAILVRVAPVAEADWRDGDRFVAIACGVLEANGRIRRGSTVSVGFLGPGTSVVQPPADVAEVGALNRALAGRGVRWQYGALVMTQSVSDSGPLVGNQRIIRRYLLEPGGGTRPPGVVATVNGAPWIVQDGGTVLLGSRLEPTWTTLPLTADFMPFMDAVINRVARGEVALLPAAPGDPTLLPDRVSEVRRDGQTWRVEGGAAFSPPGLGLYFLLAGSDTVGALAVNPDARESDLTRADDATIARLWDGARVIDPKESGRAAFSGAGRSDLRGLMLWAATLFALTEVALASGWRRRR